MANYCHNRVTFSGKAENLEEMRQLLSAAPADGVFMPEFIKRTEGHFIDLSVGADYLDYHTFWSPNLPVMIEVADHLGLDFVQRYQEAGMAVWGEASYTDGDFQNIRLVSNDHQLYSFDQACEQFEYEGQFYDDMVAVAREGNLFETDLLLVCPVKDQLTAAVFSREELLAEYEARGRGR